MNLEIRVPQLPESVADATLVAWHKQVGQPVKRDESLADLETDKVMLEVPSPANGVLREIRVPTGATVNSGQLLAIVEEAVAGTATAATAVPGASSAPAGPDSAPSPAASSVAPGESPKTGPAARRVLSENHLEPNSVVGSGPGGRITKSDALQASGDNASAIATTSTQLTAPAATSAATNAPGHSAAGTVAAATGGAIARSGRTEHRVPMTRLRARIAERMVLAQSTQALLTSFNEIDLSAVQELRARYRESFEKKHGVKLGLMSFFVKATVEALRRFPIINASVENNDIVYHEYFDIGVAVSTERGLMVPVLRDADGLSFADIEKSIGQFAARARDGSITLQDLTGGTFSITNGGIFGSLLSTPIVNAPQSAILGMHKIQDRAMVLAGQVQVRPMMYVAVTYDHRIIDGREAVQFLVAIKDSLEDPGRLLLGV